MDIGPAVSVNGDANTHRTNDLIHHMIFVNLGIEPSTYDLAVRVTDHKIKSPAKFDLFCTSNSHRFFTEYKMYSNIAYDSLRCTVKFLPTFSTNVIIL